MTDLTGLIGSVALVMALTQLVKPMVPNTKYHPVIAVVWGMVTNILIIWLVNTTFTKQLWGQAAMSGLIAGLAAGGLYDKAHDSAGDITPTKMIPAATIEAIPPPATSSTPAVADKPTTP